MAEESTGSWISQVAEARYLAARARQPAYILAAGATADEFPVALLWSAVLATDWPRIAAVALPDGAILARAAAPGQPAARGEE